jgi:hypothetical protein
VRRFGNGDPENSAAGAQFGWRAAEINTFVSIYQTMGKHYLFGLCDREALMIWSISRELILLVPFGSYSFTNNSQYLGLGSGWLHVIANA